MAIDRSRAGANRGRRKKSAVFERQRAESAGFRRRVFTDIDVGLVPASGGTPGEYLDSTGTFSVPAGGGGGGVTDHGALTGLTPDDDHPQYALADGSRPFTGAPTSNVAASTPTQLVRKGEMDAAITTHEAAPDPHSQYTTDAEATTLAAAEVTTHEGAANPHTQYAPKGDLTASGLNISADKLAGRVSTDGAAQEIVPDASYFYFSGTTLSLRGGIAAGLTSNASLALGKLADVADDTILARIGAGSAGAVSAVSLADVIAASKAVRVIDGEHGNPVRAVSSTAYSSVGSLTIPANLLETGSRVVAEWECDVLQNGATQSSKCRIYCGSQYFTSASSNFAADPDEMSLWLRVTIAAVGTNAQYMIFENTVGEAHSWGGRWWQQSNGAGAGYLHATQSTSSDIVVDFQHAFGSTTTNSDVTLYKSTLTYYPPP